MMENYIDTPCPCKEGDQCPHYGVQLEGMLWRISRADTERARQYRALWVAAVKNKRPAMRKVVTPKKGCNCGKRKTT